MLDITFKIAGQAGQGMQSIAYVLGKLLTRTGYHVFINQDIMSRIRGGHNFTAIRISGEPVLAPAEKVNLLIALDEPSLELHKDELVEGGVAIYDAEQDPLPAGARADIVLFPVPMMKYAKSIGKNPVLTNVVALGAVIFLTGYPIEALLAILRDTFAGKDAAVIGANLKCAQAGFDYAAKYFRKSCPCRIDLPKIGEPRLFLTGNEAIALGAISAGLKFHSGYPMSPSTPIMEYLAANGGGYSPRGLGVIVEQAEDEIGAINMALGASYAGVRSMTATSGGGFALMVEGLGLSAISETPVVIVVCSRPGPATGFPTRTEQADLLFVLYAGQDEFPRLILAPGTAEQAFYAMGRAFDLSQKYQVPAFVLSDQFLSDSYATVDGLDCERIPTQRYDARQQWRDAQPYTYQRYAVMPHRDLPLPADVCLRIYPGLTDQVVRVAGHEHDESGLITESAEVRTRMMDRRLGKLESLRAELGGITCWPAESDPATLALTEVSILCFGSTFGPVREAVARLRAEGKPVRMVHLSEVYPLPAKHLEAAVARSRRLITVENNATAQLAQLIHAETRMNVERSVLKYDGRPFTGEEAAREIERLL